jgi:CDP-diacylglycerol---serine O-phosphatidyltransferase
MRKIYLVPNFVTTANMFCGFFSVISAFHHDYVTAAWAIMAAGICDMLDGRIARMAKATSQFGVEYDSLSDLISFGAAPAILVYLWALEPFDRLGMLAAFLYMTCGALRLARFNVNSSALPKNYFQGLPIPMAAGMIATFIIFNQTVEWPFSRPATVLVLTLSMASLMVSTIRFPSFKDLNWRSRATFGYLMVGVMSMILIAAKPEVTLFLLLSTYLGLSLLWNVVRLVLSNPETSQGQSKAGATTPYESRT